MAHVPVIDLKTSANPGHEIVAAFRSIGFAYLEGHGVSEKLQARLEEVCADFFARPWDEKLRFAMKNSGRAWRGFFPLGGELTSGQPDQKEGFYFGIDHSLNHPNVLTKTPTFGLNPWPSPQMKTVITDYMAEMKHISFQLMALIAKGLGLADDFFLHAFTDQPTEFFRVFAYPKHLSGSAKWGVCEHTDMGFLTVLKQDQSGGLQAKMLNDEWTEVPPRPNAFVLNVGDMLEYWTGGVLRSTPHRVRNPVARERFSYPYFFDPHWASSLKPIDPARLTHFPKPQRVAKRWDGLELHALSSASTYGDFVWKKISTVFPALAEQ